MYVLNVVALVVMFIWMVVISSMVFDYAHRHFKLNQWLLTHKHCSQCGEPGRLGDPLRPLHLPDQIHGGLLCDQCLQRKEKYDAKHSGV